MEASDVRFNLNWVNVEDWSSLPATGKVGFGKPRVCKADIDIFVEYLFRDVARKLKIRYRELDVVLKEENSAFFAAIDRLFPDEKTTLKATAPQLVTIEKQLKIPDVSSLK